MGDRRILQFRQVASTLPVGLHRAELDVYEDDHDFLRAMRGVTLRLRAFVLTDHVATETHPVRFKRRVKVRDGRTRVTLQRPAGRWQMLRYLLGLRCEWVQAWYYTGGQERSVWVEVEDEVKIHREFAYPEATLKLPAEQFGRAFLYEHVETLE